MQTFWVLGLVYSRLAGYFKVVFRAAVIQQVSEMPCSSSVSIDWWRQRALATSKIRLFKHLIVDIQFWKRVLWSFRCFLLYIATPNQDTASFYCPWHFRKYYPPCVCNTLCPFLHTSEALEQICALQRIFIEIFLPISDLLKKSSV